jgi:iron complex transport system ATP-binding protein
MIPLVAEHVSLGYCDDNLIVHDVSLTLHAGEVVVMLGANGSGKTTLLRGLNGSLKLTAGRVSIMGHPVESLSAKQIARHIAVVPPSPPPSVPFNVLQVVMLGRYPHADLWARPSDDDMCLCERSLQQVDMWPHRDRPYGELSGGERQRVIIARALAEDAPILLMDEPNSHLDLPHQLMLYRLIRKLADEGRAVFMICHDVIIAPTFADRVAIMEGGRIVAIRRPIDIVTSDAYRSLTTERLTVGYRDSGAIELHMSNANQ